MSRIDYELAMQALLGDISECGDIGIIKEYEQHCFIALIDVLGHGAEARKVALLAESYLAENFNNELHDVIIGLHEHLKGSRGAVAALALLDVATGILEYVGVGNITIRIFGTKSQRLVLRDGIVGYGDIRPHVQSVMLFPGDVLLMHSDGIKEHFDDVDCAALLGGVAEDIAVGIMHKFGNRNDDSSCIVLKYLK